MHLSHSIKLEDFCNSYSAFIINNACVQFNLINLGVIRMTTIRHFLYHSVHQNQRAIMEYSDQLVMDMEI